MKLTPSDHSREVPSYPPLGAPSPNTSPTVGATSMVWATSEDDVPRRTRGEPPVTKNGIGSVAGWPWLPGIGLASGPGAAENRRPAGAARIERMPMRSSKEGSRVQRTQPKRLSGQTMSQARARMLSRRTVPS